MTPPVATGAPPPEQPDVGGGALPSGRLPERLLLVLSGLAIAFLLVQIVLFQYGRDQGIYAAVGRAIVEGGAPYKDIWDFKPPGVYFIYGLARLAFGDSMHAVRILEALAYVSLLPAFLVLSKRHLGQAGAGVLGCALALLYHVQLGFWHTGQPESFGGVILIWAVVLATYRPLPTLARNRLRQFAAWSGSGALFTSAALLKPPLGGGFIVSLVVITLFEWRRHSAPGRRATVFYPTACFTVGAAVTLACCLLFFGLHDALSDLYQALFVFAPHYATIGAAESSFPALLLRTVREWLFSFERVAGVAGTIGLLLLLVPSGRSERERDGVIHLLGAIVPQLVGVVLQAKLFMYHYEGIFPCAALLAGWGFWRLLRYRYAGWIVVTVITVAVAYQLTLPRRHLKGSILERSGRQLEALFNPALRNEINDRLHTLYGVDAAANRRAATWISRNTPADQPIYIWGFEPVIFQLSGRGAASRYIYNIPQRAAWSRDESRQELMRDLARSDPSVIVVVHGDKFPRVCGNLRDSRRELSRFPELRDLLAARYRKAVVIEEFELHLRKDLRSPEDGRAEAQGGRR